MKQEAEGVLCLKQPGHLAQGYSDDGYHGGGTLKLSDGWQMSSHMHQQSEAYCHRERMLCMHSIALLHAGYMRHDVCSMMNAASS